LTGFKEKIKALTRGNRDDLVTGKETEYQQLQSDPSNSQFIATEQWAGVQICSIFNEDPVDHGLAAGAGSVTYANRSDADLARFKRRQFWVTKMQNVLSSFTPDGIAVKLNVSAALMMTDMERHELFKLRLDSKSITINEIRTLGDEESFGPEYDQPGIPDGTNAQEEIERQAVILQKMYLAVGVVITADEARAMAVKAGIDLGDYDPAQLGVKPQPAIGGGA